MIDRNNHRVYQALMNIKTLELDRRFLKRNSEKATWTFDLKPIPLRNIFFMLLLALFLCSCESEDQRIERIKDEIEMQKAAAAKQKQQEARALVEKQEAERLKKEQNERGEKERLAAEKRRLAEEKERERKQIEFDWWKSNSLRTGATPWSACFGSSNSCSNGCSQISVKTPYRSDVLVTLKKNGKVVRHAYINENSTYTFEIPNGTYQPFFYYGTGWNPNKTKESKSCGTLNGAFLENELISKDDPQSLFNNILSYELILQQNGNLQTKPSNENEAF